MPDKTSTAPSATAPSYAAVASALGDVTRCEILAVLSAGGYRMVIELAELTGRKPGAISKHVTTLRRLGLLGSYPRVSLTLAGGQSNLTYAVRWKRNGARFNLMRRALREGSC